MSLLDAGDELSQDRRVADSGPHAPPPATWTVTPERLRALLRCAKALRSLNEGWECDCGNCADCEAGAALRDFDATRVGGGEPAAPRLKCAGCIANDCGSTGLEHTCGKGEEPGTSRPSAAWAYKGQLRIILERLVRDPAAAVGRTVGHMIDAAIDDTGALIDDVYRRGLQVGRASGIEEVVRAAQAVRDGKGA